MREFIPGFVIGAIAGVAGTWLYFKKKYDQKCKQTDEELEEMKQYYVKRSEDSEKPQRYIYSGEPPEVEEPEGSSKIDNPLGIGWKRPSDEPQIPEYGKMFKNTEEFAPPRIISSDEFYDEISYTKITLTYYSIDRILADDDGYMVEDVSKLVGTEWEKHFGEFTENVVYVRNDEQQTDYEILYTDARFVDT